MPVPLILSLTLHLALVLLAVFGLPRFSDPVDPLQAMQVSLVSTADLDAQSDDGAPKVPEPVPDPPEIALPNPAEGAPNPGDLPPIETTPPPPVDRVAPQPVPSRDLPDGVTFQPPQVAVPAPQPEPVEPQPDPSAPEEASPQTVTEAVETEDRPSPVPQTAPRPAPRPIRGAAEPEAETVLSQPVQSDRAPEAEPEPEPADPIADAIAAALAESQVPAPTDRAPVGPPLTGQERDALRLAVGRCWNLGGTSTEAMRVTVTVAMDMQPDGKPVPSTIRMVNFTGGSEKAAKDAFEAARRAILRCQRAGYGLPAEKYEQWRQIEMTFNPERMRLR